MNSKVVNFRQHLHNLSACSNFTSRAKFGIKVDFTVDLLALQTRANKFHPRDCLRGKKLNERFYLAKGNFVPACETLFFRSRSCHIYDVIDSFSRQTT